MHVHGLMVHPVSSSVCMWCERDVVWARTRAWPRQQSLCDAPHSTRAPAHPTAHTHTPTHLASVEVTTTSPMIRPAATVLGPELSVSSSSYRMCTWGVGHGQPSSSTRHRPPSPSPPTTLLQPMWHMLVCRSHTLRMLSCRLDSTVAMRVCFSPPSLSASAAPLLPRVVEAATARGKQEEDGEERRRTHIKLSRGVPCHCGAASPRAVTGPLGVGRPCSILEYLAHSAPNCELRRTPLPLAPTQPRACSLGASGGRVSEVPLLNALQGIQLPCLFSAVLDQLRLHLLGQTWGSQGWEAKEE
jgi:hypothetical protein